MIWLLLSSGFAEEETPSESNIKDAEIGVFHYGLDPVLSAKIALNYVQAVTDYSAERLSPLMMDDVFPVARSQVQIRLVQSCRTPALWETSENLATSSPSRREGIALGH